MVLFETIKVSKVTFLNELHVSFKVNNKDTRIDFCFIVEFEQANAGLVTTDAFRHVAAEFN